MQELQERCAFLSEEVVRLRAIEVSARAQLGSQRKREVIGQMPDAFFPLGLIDDLIVMVVVLDTVLGNVPRSLILKHWAGSGDIFTVVRETLQKADSWIGKGMFRRLKSYLAKQGLWPEDEAVALPPPVPAAGGPAARPKTPSRGPAGKRGAAKGAKKSAPKKASSKKASSKKTTAKKAASKRTIGAKKPSGPKP